MIKKQKIIGEMSSRLEHMGYTQAVIKKNILDMDRYIKELQDLERKLKACK